MAGKTSSAAPLRISWRVGVSLYETEKEFAKLRAFLKRHRRIVDEVCFFETVTHHLFLPMDMLRKRRDVIARRIRALKKDGVPSVGINVLTTIGHVNEAWDIMPPLPFQPMVGHDGAVSTGCACPNTPEMRAYVSEKYRLFAGAGADFIWVDDDIRMHHHGVTYACFCPTCLGIFSKSTGRAARPWTREELAAALDAPEGAPLRAAWVEQNARSIESLLSDVAAAIREVAPKTATGLMTAGPWWGGYSGNALDRWYAALDGTKFRPGGGFYSDDAPGGMIRKAVSCGQACALAPAATRADIQYELENFPYAALGKSVATVINECTLALAAGLNGIAMNALGLSVEDKGRLAREVARARRGWEKLVAHADGLPSAGLWHAWEPSYWTRREVGSGRTWFDEDGRYDFSRNLPLLEIGIPASTGLAPSDGEAVVMTGRQPDMFTDGDLRRFLSMGVFMDGAALDIVNARGLGDLTGMRVRDRLDNGVLERFTDDELNGPHEGAVRDCRIEFWGDARGLADVLEPTAVGARVLTEMEDYLGGRRGTAMAAFENSLGGRVVVGGYGGLMFLGSAEKRAQLQNVADWLTRCRLPLRIHETVKLVPFVRLAPDRSRGAVTLLNASYDDIPRATLSLRIGRLPVRVLAPDGRVSPLRAAQTPSGLRVVLGPLRPWTTISLLLG